jgi:cell division septation protein DedD
MTVEFDIKQGTEPESKGKKKKTFTFETRTILGWWMFLVCVAGCMFYLGILTGRESAPVYFDVHEIDSDLMELVDSALNPENTDVVMPETAETSDLEFYEVLKGNKGGNKKIAEIEDTLKYRPKTEDIQPEKFPKKTESAGEETKDQSEGNKDSAVNGHVKPDDKTGQPKKTETASSKQPEKTVIKDEKKTALKKAETENTGTKPAQTVKTEKAKSDLASKADNQKKEVKTVSEKTKDTRQTDTKTTAGAASPTKKTGNLSSESATIKTNDQQQTGIHQTEASKAQASEKGNAQKQTEVRKNEKSADKPDDKLKESPDLKTAAKPVTKQEKTDPQKKETQKSLKYTIQAGAVKTHEDAESIVKKLSASGIGAAVVKGKGSDGSEWYRIRIGSYSDREKASKMAETVKGAGFPAMVINVPQE